MSEYRGLVNEGATCYLNSLLQTLFMTPEFRSNIYQFVHDSRKISETDSIPYQLEKMFVKLQQNKGSVNSRGLLRSFQWNAAQSFQQHDVQQFCRILFEAIQKVFKTNNWIERIYSGTVVSYISCGKHVRQSPQLFMDISLPIRNMVTNQSYKSIQECLKQYIHSEKLEDVQCEQCGERVEVEKGMKFTVLPPILTLQLNRFQLNYTTFQRQKMNNFVYYPQILEMDKFLKPYSEIQISSIPKDLQKKTKLQAKQKSARTTDWGDLSIQGIKIQKKNSDQIQTKKEKVKFLDEENQDKRGDITKELSIEEQKNKNKQILQDLKAQKGKIDEKMNKIASKQPHAEEKKKEEKEENIVDPLEDDMLFGSFMADVPKGISTSGAFDKDTPIFEKSEAMFEHDEEAFDLDKQYSENTYVLYSILVHNGGAYGGHYYAYIFNGQNWYCFNDNQVTKVSRKQIRKYGHPSQNSSFGNNAYLLFYREAKSFKADILSSVQIPKELLQKVENDTAIEVLKQEQQSSKATMQNNLNKKLLLKIYWYGKDPRESLNKQIEQENNILQQQTPMSGSNQHETLVIDNRFQQNIQGLINKVRDLMGIQTIIPDQNWRLRRYNKIQDSVHEVYGFQISEKTLDQVGLRQTCYIAIETKTDEEKFEKYDPKNIVVKLNVWREGLTILTQHYLKPKKISIRDEKSFQQFYEKVENATGLKNPIVIKRNFSSGKVYDKFTLEQNKDKSLISMRFFNGINLYVQPQIDGKLLWENQFQSQKYRCLIKYNNPKLGFEKNQQIHFDTRKTLGDLKTALSQKIKIPFEDFRIKKSQQTVSQMITYKKRLVDLRFINNQLLYIEQGKSSKGSLLIRKGTVQLIDDKVEYTLGDEIQIQLNSSITSCADFKNILATKVSLQPFNIRIREYKAFQFGEIFQDTCNIQRLKDRSLVWEQIQIEDPRGLQIYVRVFDIVTMQLGPIHTIFVEESGNYEELTLILEEQTFIQADKMLAWRAPSNYFQKSIFFDIEWEQIRFITKPIREQPMFLSNSGEILILKQAQNAYHPKPDKKFSSSQYSDDYSAVSKGARKNEASLKITVIQEKQLVQQILEQGDPQQCIPQEKKQQNKNTKQQTL